MFVGSWSVVREARISSIEWIENQALRVGDILQGMKWKDYERFEEVIFNQHIRFAYKTPKRYILEKHPLLLKGWDLTS